MIQTFYTFCVVPFLLYLGGCAFTSGFVSKRFQYDDNPAFTRGVAIVFWPIFLMVTTAVYVLGAGLRPIRLAGSRASDHLDTLTGTERIGVKRIS